MVGKCQRLLMETVFRSHTSAMESMSAQSIEAPQFLLLAKEQVLLDVRSPGEFAQGHIPGAVNLPLFDDDERAEVGKLYKNSGRDLSLIHI